MKVILSLISNGDQFTIEYFLGQNIIQSIKQVMSNVQFKPQIFVLSLKIVEKLLSYDEKRLVIVKILGELEFNYFFENVYYKFKNPTVNQHIERILTLCSQRDEEQMQL